MVMDGVVSVLPANLNLADVYENSSDDEQNFIQDLSLFLCTFLGAHVRVRFAFLKKTHLFKQEVENAAATQPRFQELLNMAHQYLLNISMVRDREVFKICLEYWAKLVSFFALIIL